MQTATTAPTFETKPCSRCGGSGHYSYCQMYGTTCFGCSGKGTQLTKRGAAARRFYLDSIARTYADVQAGWRLFDNGSGWRTVLAVEVATPEQLADRAFGARGVPGTGGSTGKPQEWIAHTHRIVTKHVQYIGDADSKVTAYADKAERDEKLAAAFAYQDTLTQAGKPRKRAARCA